MYKPPQDIVTDILNEDIVNKAYSKSDKDCTSLYLSERLLYLFSQL